jgi:uncharacterized protein (TIGR04255 family)
MGKWKNAPVAYVIVQVRFSPVLSLKTYIAQIQEHFRKDGFPAFENRFNFQFPLLMTQSIEPETAPPAIPWERTLSYVFTNREQSQSFVLEQNGLTFHVTDYLDFSWFLDLFLKHLDHINEVLKPDSSERIGLRYIDTVIPKAGANIGKYLIPDVLGLSQHPLGGAFQQSFSETMFLDRGTSTVSRVLVRQGQIAFPPDMASLPVLLNSRFTEYNGVHAIVDTDSYQTSRSPMDTVELRHTLTYLHQSVDRAFHVVTTDFALADWK